MFLSVEPGAIYCLLLLPLSGTTIPCKQTSKSVINPWLMATSTLCTSSSLCRPVSAARPWNSLPTTVTSAPSFNTSRQRLKTQLFTRSFQFPNTQFVRKQSCHFAHFFRCRCSYLWHYGILNSSCFIIVIIICLLTDVHSASHVSSPATTVRRSPSVLSGKSDADSASTVIASITRGSNLSPLQLLEVGKYLLHFTFWLFGKSAV